MKFAELGPKNPAYLAYSQREAALRGIQTPKAARRDAVILFTCAVARSGLSREETNRGPAAPCSNDASCVAALAIFALRRAMCKTVRRSRPFARLAARQIVISAQMFHRFADPAQMLQELNPLSATARRTLHCRRALQTHRRRAQTSLRLRHHSKRDRATATVCYPHRGAIGSSNGLHYIVMPYIQGEDLASFVRREGCLRPKKADVFLNSDNPAQRKHVVTSSK
jgi:hypothetical protein